MNKSRKDGLILQQKCSGEGNISSYLEFLTLALNKTQFLHFKWEGCDILCVYISYIYMPTYLCIRNRGYEFEREQGGGYMGMVE